MDNRLKASEAMCGRIVAAASALHSEKGILATSWADIAERADVAIRTVYRYFPSYEELIPACTSHFIGRRPPPAPDLLHRVPPSRRFPRLVGDLYAFYEGSARFIEKGLGDRARVPALEAAYRRREEGRERLVREALGDASQEARAIAVALALTDFSTWRSLTNRRLSTGEAAELACDLFYAWRRTRRTRGDRRKTSPSREDN